MNGKQCTSRSVGFLEAVYSDTAEWFLQRQGIPGFSRTRVNFFLNNDRTIQTVLGHDSENNSIMSSLPSDNNLDSVQTDFIYSSVWICKRGCVQPVFRHLYSILFCFRKDSDKFRVR